MHALFKVCVYLLISVDVFSDIICYKIGMIHQKVLFVHLYVCSDGCSDVVMGVVIGY